MAFIQFSKVSLAFGDRDILKNVSVNLQAGTKAALTGANGAGKSTLINYIKNNSEKNIVLVCPTALAATTIGGSTIHSLFRLEPKDYFDLSETLTKRNKSNDKVLLLLS